jgi:hypothetical protein
MVDHLTKEPTNRVWTIIVEERYPRPLLVIGAATLLSWSIIILVVKGALRLLGL